MSRTFKLPVTHASGRRVHIHGLNGLRAFAVAFVVLYHYFPFYFPGGLIGVDIFFVISGYLITALLIAELQQQGFIRFKNFWVRRIRRLFPALILMISVCSTVAVLSKSSANAGLGPQLLGALTYTNNWLHIITNRDYFQHDNPELFTNLWSISVEEQFYLFWPIVLVLIAIFIKRWKVRGFAASILALSSVLLMIFLYSTGAESTRVYYGTDTHAFGLMLGATVAFWNPTSLLTFDTSQQPLTTARWDKRIVGARRAFDLQGMNALIALFLLISFLFILNEKQDLLYGLGLFATSILSAKIIDALISTTPGSITLLLHRILGNRQLTWLGERSYGIYLWHWPVYVLLFYLLPSYRTNTAALALTILLTVIIAALSYRFLEKPIRKHGFRRCFNKITSRAFGPSSRSSRRLGLLLFSTVCTASVVITTFGAFTAPIKHSTVIQVTENKKFLEQQEQLEKTELQPPPPDKPRSPADMVFVGDSVVLGAAPEIKQAFPEAYIDAAVSRSFTEGIKIVEKMRAAGTLRPIIIFALATNGMVTVDMVNSLMTAVGSERQVILVTAYADRPWIAPANQTLREAADNYRNTLVADWQEAIAPHPDLLAPDQVHPEPEGAKLFAEVVKNGINASTRDSASKQEHNNPEKLWPKARQP